MDLSDYQRRADETNVLAKDGPLMPLLGLTGEVGQLVAEYKKHLRDKTGYRAFKDEIGEELGDILWYAAALASHNGLDLDQIAIENLAKTKDIFGISKQLVSHRLFDEDDQPDQQLPRHLTITLVENEETNERGERLLRVRMYKGDRPVGDPLDDNSEHDDNYRYHDVFHLGHLAILGWSPVMRRLLGCKRRMDPSINRIQDGGRALAIEEGVTAYIFTIATENSFFATLRQVPPSVLKTCSKMTSHLEVAERSRGDWQHAILAGYDAFRQVVEHSGGILTVDLQNRTLSFDGPPPT